MKKKEQRKVSVFRIEYDTHPNMNHYDAYVAALSHEEAVVHVKKVMGADIYITASGLVCPLHDLTTTVRALVKGLPIGDKKAKETKKAEPVDEPAVEEVPEETELSFKSGRGRKPGWNKK